MEEINDIVEWKYLNPLERKEVLEIKRKYPWGLEQIVDTYCRLGRNKDITRKYIAKECAGNKYNKFKS